MFWAGAVKCPNCSSPLDVESTICPYCHSTAPGYAEWQGWPGGWYWSYLPALVGVAAFAVAWASDRWFGTDWLQELLKMLAE